MRRDTIHRILLNTLSTVDPNWDPRRDANESLNMARSLEHMFKRVYEFEYPESAGRRLVPLNYEIPSGARSHVYQMTDDVGEAELIESYADDLPSVDAVGQEHAHKIVGLGGSFHVSLQDLRAAAMSGVPLSERKANVARKAVERKLDQLLCTGNTKIGFTGFANNANVALAAGLTGTWNTATAAQICADVEKIAKTIFDTTLGIHGNPDNGSKITLALPPTRYSRLATLRLDSFNTMTVLEYIKAHNPFIAEITSWARLETAGAASVPRVVAYHKDPDVIEGMIPQEFEMLPMQARALAWLTPCHMRYGGCIVRQPGAMLYADGC